MGPAGIQSPRRCDVIIRRFQLSDARPCHAVFREAVHQGAAAFYTEGQRAAWAPQPTMPDAWPDRLADQITHVAEGADGIEGFFTLNHDGHLDLAYVRPRVMGTGLAARLYQACLNDPQAAEIERLYTEASHLSKRFFEKQGWTVIARQEVERFGVMIPNFRMEKRLDATEMP